VDTDVSDDKGTCQLAALPGGEWVCRGECRDTNGALGTGQGTAPASPAPLPGPGLWGDPRMASPALAMAVGPLGSPFLWPGIVIPSHG